MRLPRRELLEGGKGAATGGGCCRRAEGEDNRAARPGEAASGLSQRRGRLGATRREMRLTGEVSSSSSESWAGKGALR